MADYARRGDQAQWMRNQAEQTRRMRTARPRRGGIPAPAFTKEGIITVDRVFAPCLFTVEPDFGSDLPEHKQIVGFDGWLGNGASVTITWASNEGFIHEGHVISGSSGAGGNRVVLDEPFIIENGIYGGEFIQPQITAVEFSPIDLSCIVIIETVPI